MRHWSLVSPDGRVSYKDKKRCHENDRVDAKSFAENEFEVD